MASLPPIITLELDDLDDADLDPVERPRRSKAAPAAPATPRLARGSAGYDLPRLTRALDLELASYLLDLDAPPDATPVLDAGPTELDARRPGGPHR